METGGIRVWMRRASVLRPATACVHEVEPAVDVHGVRETSICHARDERGEDGAGANKGLLRPVQRCHVELDTRQGLC